MTPEQRRVHEKLSSTLPLREHRLPDEPRIAKPKGKHRQERPVIIHRKRYPSICAASRGTGISRQLIHQRLIAGKRGFVYADDPA